MRLLSLLALVLLTTTSSLFSQNTTYEKHWEHLFRNERKEALSTLRKSKDDDIAYFLSQEIIKAENGNFTNPDDFIQQLMAYKDFEYYLYALWTQNFFFDGYIESGFNNKNSKNIKDIDLGRIKNPTVLEAMKYLKSIVARHNNDWEGYYRMNSEMASIKKWQYCGTFENLNGSGLDIAYEPEEKAYSEEDFNANSNGFVNWYNNGALAREAYQFYSNHSEYGAGVNYAQTFIANPIGQRVVLGLGSSALAKVWVNDVVVLENTNDGITDLDAYNVAFTLPKGVNRILVKNADQSGIGYFIARLTDVDGNALNNLEVDPTYRAYNKSSLASLQPVGVDNSVEAYFKVKVAQNPNNFFYTYCLVSTYLRNSKYTEAKKIILPLIKAHNNSSFLRRLLILSYNLEKDYTSSQELQKNIEKDDGKYYLSYVYRFQESGELFKLPIKEFEKFTDEFKAATDMPILKHSADLMLSIRKEDKGAIKEKLKYITTNFKDQTKLIKLYISLYSDYLNEDENAIEVLESINDLYFDYPALKKLAGFYDKQNKKEQVIQLFKEQYNDVNSSNSYLKDYIEYLHEYKKYEESLPFIKKVLDNYPYSFIGMEYMGNALEQLGRKKEALVYYKRSLKHNGGNSALRKKIEDLSGTKDYFEDLATGEIYDFIAKNRNKETKNNYGYNYLLDETLVQLYAEGGYRNKNSYVVEITSESGIESMKELDLGLRGNYRITKSEIVKPNKTVVPASKNGSNLVFGKLEVGDVIYIDYESSSSSSGRFYKDYVDYFQMDSYHPILKNSLKILVPKEKPFKFRMMNGEVPHQERKMDDYICHIWQIDNLKPLEQQEDYMPSMADIARYLHISTIDSWDDIATWYADLVRPQMQINSDVEEAFKEIFPESVDMYFDNEKAERIYYYLMENLSYSYVSFRQSGYVPQRPAKTIKSKLGDCKDFSTLYVTLAQMAGLKSHLVLVLTSDYGKQAMLLPSQDFNHCIVKVFIDGKPQYLELTDNNLPFKSIPTSLENATALDIPNKVVKDVHQGVYLLNDIAHTPTVIESNMVYRLKDKEHQLKIESVLKGSINSNYASILKEDNYEVIKTKITDDFKGRLLEDFSLDSIYDIQYDIKSPVIAYTSDLTINETIDEIGSMKVFRIPAVNNAYNSGIISDEKRNFPIEYIFYENADVYKSSYKILLGENEKFVEVPESVDFKYRKHSYKITYELIKPNELQIDILANTSKERIEPSEYEAFKSYVKSVLDTKEQLIGYKKIKPQP
ncbi:transglutaminase domain-containing protein [Maribacter polysiphoniae]|uniref:transglutaminase domain-containing protein n=1 Tax=Maribacter polysiphoniae TaxID=429344 RepID=UPI002352974B|nr:transglutaminase domain-containing protein [Maribacter polysiphoniae]